jgi:O-antigen ligase
VKVLTGLGVLAFQSRGAIIALVAGVLVTMARSPVIRRRTAPALVILVPLALFAFFSLDSQLERQQETGTSSITERDRYRDLAIDAWHASPMVGQGMRFFTSGRYALDSDPHNIIVASLSETGVVGLVALLGLLAFTLRVTWRLGSGLALAATAAVVARFTHGLFDVYWVAGTQLLPWILVGMALTDRSERDPSTRDEPTAADVRELAPARG